MIPAERVIKLAKEAGFSDYELQDESLTGAALDSRFERFADLIQSEPTVKESLTVEPVATVCGAPEPQDPYDKNLIPAWLKLHPAHWLLPVGTGLFTHPAEDAKDAARYRWLRKQHWSESSICVVMHPKNAVRLGHECPSEERLDDFIDAAIDKVIQEAK